MNEIKDGFVITPGRRKLWEVELTLIDFVEDICTRYKLNYFLIGGAAIGAVRHGGFIPWDDDMDIGMLRSDFEKFVSLAKNLVPNNVVIEYGLAPPNLSSTFLRIRRTDTTAIIANQLNIEREHGVFIEIYPFDMVPSNESIRKKTIKKSAWLKAELDFRLENRQLHTNAAIRHFIFQFISTQRLWDMWMSTCTRFNQDTTNKMVDTLALPGYANQGIHLYHLDDVASSVYVNYEGHKVRIAKGNDRCLKIHFGNYMELPPIEERGMKHSTVVFYDAFVPWQAYMNNNTNIVEKFFSGNYLLSNIW